MDQVLDHLIPDTAQHPEMTIAGTVVAGCLVVYMSTLMSKRLWNQADSQTQKQINSTVEHYIASVLYPSIIQNLIILIDRENTAPSSAMPVTNTSVVSLCNNPPPQHMPRLDKSSRAHPIRRISADACSSGNSQQQQLQQRHDSLSGVEDTCPFPTPQRSLQSFSEVLLSVDDG